MEQPNVAFKDEETALNYTTAGNANFRWCGLI